MVRDDDSAPKILAGRVQYKRLDICGITNVIYEVYADGRDVFFESGPGELRWYQFAPTCFERKKALDFLSNGVRNGVVDMRER